MDATREFSAFVSYAADVKLHDSREHYVFPILSKCVRIGIKTRTRSSIQGMRGYPHGLH